MTTISPEAAKGTPQVLFNNVKKVVLWPTHAVEPKMTKKVSNINMDSVIVKWSKKSL